MTTSVDKAKRRLSNFDFSHNGAHVALCSKTINGGAANGYTSIVIKSMEGLGDEGTAAVDILKDVTVTMTFQEFLRKFFGLWFEDAEVLARALGFEAEDTGDEVFEEFIESKVSQINIMKEANESEDADKFLSENMTVVQAAEVLKLQSSLEQRKEFVNYKVNKEGQPISKADNDATTSGTPTNKGNNDMSDDQKVEITKSELDELNKALEEAKTLKAEVAELKKAKDEKFKTEVTDLVKTFSFVDEGSVEETVEVLIKAKDIEGGDKILDILTKANKAIAEFVDKEEGVDTSEESEDEGSSYENSVVKYLKANK